MPGEQVGVAWLKRFGEPEGRLSRVACDHSRICTSGVDALTAGAACGLRPDETRWVSLVVRFYAFLLEPREPLLHLTDGFEGMPCPLLELTSDTKWRA